MARNILLTNSECTQDRILVIKIPIRKKKRKFGKK